MNVISVSFSGTNKPYAYKGSFYVRVEWQSLMIDPLVLRGMIKNSQEYNQRRENEITTHGIEDVDEKSLDMFYRQVRLLEDQRLTVAQKEPLKAIVIAFIAFSCSFASLPPSPIGRIKGGTFHTKRG